MTDSIFAPAVGVGTFWSFLTERGYPVVKGALANAVLFEPLMISETTASAFKDQFIALFGRKVPGVHVVPRIVRVK